MGGCGLDSSAEEGNFVGYCQYIGMSVYVFHTIMKFRIFYTEITRLCAHHNYRGSSCISMCDCTVMTQKYYVL
jgi:hypothetical protein